MDTPGLTRGGAAIWAVVAVLIAMLIGAVPGLVLGPTWVAGQEGWDGVAAAVATLLLSIAVFVALTPLLLGWLLRRRGHPRAWITAGLTVLVTLAAAGVAWFTGLVVLLVAMVPLGITVAAVTAALTHRPAPAEPNVAPPQAG